MTIETIPNELLLPGRVIDEIANDGCRNAAGGIYATRVHEFARAIEAEVWNRRHPAPQAPISGSGSDTARQDEQKSPHSDRAAQQEPAGWKLVPIEPTPAMVSAIVDAADAASCGYMGERAELDGGDGRQIYSAMLAAAPSRSGGAAALSEARPQDSVHQVDAPSTPLPLGSDASRTAK